MFVAYFIIQLSHSCSINRMQDQYTTLFLACFAGHLPCVQLLLEPLQAEHGAMVCVSAFHALLRLGCWMYDQGAPIITADSSRRCRGQSSVQGDGILHTKPQCDLDKSDAY